MKKNFIFKVFAAVLTLVLTFAAINPVTALAVAPPNQQTWIWTASQLQSKNLSVGTISWNDDLVTGYIETYENCGYWNNGRWVYDGKYTVYLNEVYNISDMPDRNMTKKQIAKRQAQIAFVPIRAAAQNKGWWDCQWNYDVVRKNKVAASATVEYKSVTMNRNSKSVYIRQITKKKNGRWETMFFVGDKSYTPSQITSVFS